MLFYSVPGLLTTDHWESVSASVGSVAVTVGVPKCAITCNEVSGNYEVAA